MKQHFCIILALAMALAGCRRAEYHTASGAVWGTTYHITYRSAADLSDSVLAEMRRVELSLSAFDNGSLLTAVNMGRTDSVDVRFEQVFAVAQRVYALSDGAFDPTVGPLVELWGFGRNRTAAQADSAAVAAALERVCFDRCSIVEHRVQRPRADVQFDFSAIAKGYGVDCVAALLQRNGVSDFMVEIGGEVVVSGCNPHGQAWRIMVDAPQRDTAPGDSAVTVLSLHNEAVATSGNYRNYRSDSTGAVYGHTINPRTGYPVRTTTLSATVVCSSCVEADALATACMVMHPDSAMSMLQRAGARGLLVIAADTAGYEIKSTLQ